MPSALPEPTINNEIRQQLLETELDMYSSLLGSHEEMILSEQAATLARFLHHPHLTEGSHE